jgi:hypothetical protein
MTDDAALPPVQYVCLEDVLGQVEFRGRELAHVSTYSTWVGRDGTPQHSRRWSEFTLYGVEEGSCRYALYIEGLSTMTHRLGSSCGKGVTTEVKDLPEDAEACPDCRPDLRREKIVAFEEDRRTLYRADTPQEVLRHLKESGRNRSAVALSNPAQRLLEEAGKHDPAFNRENRVETL